MNKRKPSDVWPSRRRANRIVLASFIVAAVLEISFYVLEHTFLLVDGWPVTVISALMVSSGIAVLMWIGGVIWALRHGEWLALAIMAVLCVYGGGLMSPFVFPTELVQHVKTDGRTFYLINVWESQFDPDAMLQCELIACEGDSQWLNDCERLWSEQAFFTPPGGPVRIDTYLIVNHSERTVQVQAKHQLNWIQDNAWVVEEETLYTHRITEPER